MRPTNSQVYSLNQIKNMLNKTLEDETTYNKLYSSVDSVARLVNAMHRSDGNSWASHVVDENGQPILSPEEQIEFQEKFKPYISQIQEFFGNKTLGGGVTDDMPFGLSDKLIEQKLKNVSQRSVPIDIDDTYVRMLKKFQDMDNSVKGYASRYGILRLEKEHDLQEDIPLIPSPLASIISTVVAGLSSGTVPPPVTLQILDKIRAPFRLIVVVCYLVLDMIRLSVGVQGNDYARKMMSIGLALVDFLRGDWKRAVMTFVGVFGKVPLFMGEIGKVFLVLFGTLSPQLQNSILLGSLDVGKSFIVGTLLSVFQVTAPELIRKQVIGALEKMAEIKANQDNLLVKAGMSARPDYLAPSYDDFANIQAIISDDVLVCSQEFQQALSVIKDNNILRIILEILRIPVNDEFTKERCGETNKTYSQRLSNEAIQRKEEENVLKNTTKFVAPSPFIEEKNDIQESSPAIPKNSIKNTRPLRIGSNA